MTATLLSEWTKFRSQRAALIALGAMCALMTGMSVLAASETETQAVFAGDDDVVQIGLSGVVFAALAAKAVVLTVVTFPFALAASALGFVISQSLLHDRGYVPPAYPPVSLTDPGAARAVTGTALLLTAYALLALGVGTIIRHSGSAIATGIALVLVPILMLGVFPQEVRVRIEQSTPLAGMAVQSTTDRMLSAFDGSELPIGPWQGLGVACAWALGSLLAGYLLLRARDA
jgi:ABC-2 type transport system permease protein